MRYLITTPIYYVNAKPHIGHAYTTLAADILVRYFRMRGDEVFFLTGTDEHGSKIAEVAAKNSMQPQAWCDQVALEFKKAWETLGVSYDYFVRTTDERHVKCVEKFVSQLQEKGVIYEAPYEGLYCVGCEKFLLEKDLVEGKCPDHQRVPEQLSEKNYFFALSKYLKKLQTLINKDTIQILPESKKKEVLGLFKQDMSDFSISRQHVTWGIPLPFDPSQLIYVWPDALTNYISAIGYGDNEEEFIKWWKEAKVIHLMGKEILKFHALYWPAMLLALDIKTPEVIFAHGFFSINGQKMSKTLGNVIDPSDLVKEFGVDGARYLIVSQFPFGTDGDIVQHKFGEKYKADLAHGIGNLVSRVVAMTHKYEKGLVPDVASDPFDIPLHWKLFDEAMEKYDIFEAVQVMNRLVGACNKYVDDTKPWVLAKQGKTKELSEVLYRLLEGVWHVSCMAKPFMPETAEKIQALFETKSSTLMSWGQLEEGREVKTVSPLFMISE